MNQTGARLPLSGPQGGCLGVQAEAGKHVSRRLDLLRRHIMNALIASRVHRTLCWIMAPKRLIPSWLRTAMHLAMRDATRVRNGNDYKNSKHYQNAYQTGRDSIENKKNLLSLCLAIP